MATFQEFGLEPKVTKAITEMGFEEATPIQAKTIPLALQGHDLIGQAQTGTGKTAAFGVPLINKIDTAADKIVALVMCPTRELAIQVAEEISKLGRFKGIRSLPIYGGQDIVKQIRALKKKPQIIIGTPGRLLDHINRKTIKLEGVETVVLDEADEMLDMGFMDDIQSILSQVPEERHTMLFSATMPPNIQKLAHQFLRNPQHVSVIPKQVSAPLIAQAYIEVHEKQKFEALSRLLDMEAPELAIIFGRTKRRVDELSEALQKRGYAAEGLHGDLSQNQRDNVMRKFRDGSIDVLVATDVAARGLDVSGVSHVINFDLPQDPESYVHRIGRTGRAGKEGTAWTFVTPREIDHLHFIEKVTRHKISRKPLPSLAEAMEGKQKMTAERILELMEKDNHQEFKGVAIQLLEQYDSVNLLAAALKLLTGEKKDVNIELTPEEPLRAKKRRFDVRNSGRKPYGNDRRSGGYRSSRKDGYRDRDKDRRGGRDFSNRDYSKNRTHSSKKENFI
ncbi:DEAD/DEAH box helicase [Paenibacillus larvae]|uniref:DEAD-box ATP-dependent RNA helicase CshA n=4 Tax=Paenibacillus larvae TaxID=1464 RepID=V9W5S3_9BACL|nr:DEAD/DEAH box helicase [Paenibacillus larvae]AHD05020.1 DEAD-box ATP-dependent RNA helicase CshA [Paenibacillus larvae subsp. larvae DSM 25430]AQR77982.1 DEAD/DEAH box helicase [Paenibacillus larvae subsp. larvae]AQT85988.1 DEAD/DEAH box helicase [Paenibacillus larvae subsp. pulvifaciens]AQZ45770.1 DEAD/DEAH box helicase [Paenibacillus larvae subsp. pulvifaciens]ARF69303.1 DEAD/DEAH box helicase [Paenibacillus larvae subsp. pulvifaciens]